MLSSLPLAGGGDRGAARALDQRVAQVAQLGLAAQERHALGAGDLRRLEPLGDRLHLAEDLRARSGGRHPFTLTLGANPSGRTLTGVAEGEQQTLAPLADLLVLVED